VCVSERVRACYIKTWTNSTIKYYNRLCLTAQLFSVIQFLGNLDALAWAKNPLWARPCLCCVFPTGIGNLHHQGVIVALQWKPTVEHNVAQQWPRSHYCKNHRDVAWSTPLECHCSPNSRPTHFKSCYSNLEGQRKKVKSIYFYCIIKSLETLTLKGFTNTDRMKADFLLGNLRRYFNYRCYITIEWGHDRNHEYEWLGIWKGMVTYFLVVSHSPRETVEYSLPVTVYQLALYSVEMWKEQ
jgi:hypothetical protein